MSSRNSLSSDLRQIFLIYVRFIYFWDRDIFGTIFDYLLKSEKQKGIKAVIVYPMNALINSQSDALEAYSNTFKTATGREFPVSFAQYTGQEDEETRRRVREQLPDIILTNYMMLELLLTRPQETVIRDSIYEHRTAIYLK